MFQNRQMIVAIVDIFCEKKQLFLSAVINHLGIPSIILKACGEVLGIFRIFSWVPKSIKTMGILKLASLLKAGQIWHLSQQKIIYQEIHKKFSGTRDWQRQGTAWEDKCNLGLGPIYSCQESRGCIIQMRWITEARRDFHNKIFAIFCVFA